MKKLISILVAFAMMATLGIAMAFAADEEPLPTADAYVLTKVLKVPEGTKIPASTFKFTYTQQTSEGSAKEYPIAEQTVSFTKGTATDVTEATGTAANPFEGKEMDAGKYVYIVKETADTNTAADNEKYTYDKTEYKLYVYVDKNGNKTYTIASKAEGATTFEKDELEPGTGDSKTADAKFENTYVKTANTTPTGEETDAKGFYVQKNIVNDKLDLYGNTDFQFTITATKPALSKKPVYNYQVWNTTTNAAVTDKAGTIKTDGTAITVGLKPGERLVFTDLDIGADVTAKEADLADFNEAATLNAEAVAAITTDGASASVVEDAANALVVTNTYNKESGTEGVLINNLPYIALALVAIGGLVAYVVVRRRNADEA